MRKFSALALAAVLVVSLAGCKSEGGVAVVDAARLYQESASGKAGIEHLQKLEATMQERLMKAQEELEKAPKDDALRAKFQAEFMGYQQLVQAEQQKVVETIHNQMKDALEKARKKGGYGAVLASESVLASDPKVDITDAVLKNMDGAPLTFQPVELKAPEMKKPEAKADEKAAPADKAAEMAAPAEKADTEKKMDDGKAAPADKDEAKVEDKAAEKK